MQQQRFGATVAREFGGGLTFAGGMTFRGKLASVGACGLGGVVLNFGFGNCELGGGQGIGSVDMAVYPVSVVVGFSDVSCCVGCGRMFCILCGVSL